jgi:hypothetical protein
MNAQRTSNPWTRKGLNYVVNFRMYRKHVYVGTHTVKYFFITYHLIKWFKGEEELIRLGSRNTWRL